jgi:hypothetical protein
MAFALFTILLRAAGMFGQTAELKLSPICPRSIEYNAKQTKTWRSMRAGISASSLRLTFDQGKDELWVYMRFSLKWDS